MNVITEHYAFGEDGPIVAVGISIRTSKGLFDDYHEEFHAIVRMTVDEAKALAVALPENYASFAVQASDNSRLEVYCEEYEGYWITWHDKDGRTVREPFLFGEDGWSERFAEAIERGIKEALL